MSACNEFVHRKPTHLCLLKELFLFIDSGWEMFLQELLVVVVIKNNGFVICHWEDVGSVDSIAPCWGDVVDVVGSLLSDVITETCNGTEKTGGLFCKLAESSFEVSFFVICPTTEIGISWSGGVSVFTSEQEIYFAVVDGCW